MSSSRPSTASGSGYWSKRERERFEESHARSRDLFERAEDNLLGGVPMSWMARWPGGHPDLRR